jgi:TPR repeat protein
LAREIPALELDLKFCEKNPHYSKNSSTSCHKQQFRIASYYVMQKGSPEIQLKGYKMIKELAEHGYPDGMCLYGKLVVLLHEKWKKDTRSSALSYYHTPLLAWYLGIILNEGLVEGIDTNPEEAVVWWRRCVDEHRHIKATYEVAAAMYTGEGMAENPELAVKLFRRIANLGHAGAAYMMSECLLDGVGIVRDRSDALEWLVTAAELGHRLAQNRVICILRQDYDKLGTDESQPQDSRLEAGRWLTGELGENIRKVIVERRFTIGGGSRNPFIAARRKTKVLESRETVVP